MGYISRQIEDAYNSVLFRRHDPDGSMYYFSHEDFDGLYKQDFSFVSRKFMRDVASNVPDTIQTTNIAAATNFVYLEYINLFIAKSSFNRFYNQYPTQL